MNSANVTHEDSSASLFFWDIMKYLIQVRGLLARQRWSGSFSSKFNSVQRGFIEMEYRHLDSQTNCEMKTTQKVINIGKLRTQS